MLSHPMLLKDELLEPKWIYRVVTLGNHKNRERYSAILSSKASIGSYEPIGVFLSLYETLRFILPLPRVNGLLKFISAFPLGVKLQLSQSMTSLLLLMIVCNCCKVQVQQSEIFIFAGRKMKSLECFSDPESAEVSSTARTATVYKNISLPFPLKLWLSGILPPKC